MIENHEYLTVAEAAAHLRLSRNTIIRRFASHPDVLQLGVHSETTRKSRKYRILRIPRRLVTALFKNRLC
jgi:hypothetical protein